MSFSAVRLYVVRVLVMHSLPVSWIFWKRWCGPQTERERGGGRVARKHRAPQDEITCFRISETWRKHATPCFRYVYVKVVRFRCIRSNGNARKRHETGNGNTGYPSCFRNGLTCFCHVSVYGFLQFRPVHSLEEHWVIVEKVMIYKDNCYRSLLWPITEPWFKLARDSQLFLDTICSISPTALTWFLMNWTREARLVILVFRLCSHEDSRLIIETKSFHLSATCRWPFILMGISSTRFSTQLLVYDLPGERLILNNLQHVVFAK